MIQLEALRSGMLLVTTSAFGGYEAFDLAKRLPGDLRCWPATPEALAAGIERALALPETQRRAYRRQAQALTEPYTQAALAEVVRTNLPAAIQQVLGGQL